VNGRLVTGTQALSGTGLGSRYVWHAAASTHGSRNTGMEAGVKPRSREAVRLWARGFTRDDGPGEDECGVLESGEVRDGSLVVRSHASWIAVSYRPVEGDG
jgi:hypothetical protein